MYSPIPTTTTAYPSAGSPYTQRGYVSSPYAQIARTAPWSPYSQTGYGQGSSPYGYSGAQTGQAGYYGQYAGQYSPYSNSGYGQTDYWQRYRHAQGLPMRHQPMSFPSLQELLAEKEASQTEAPVETKSAEPPPEEPKKPIKRSFYRRYRRWITVGGILAIVGSAAAFIAFKWNSLTEYMKNMFGRKEERQEIIKDGLEAVKPQLDPVLKLLKDEKGQKKLIDMLLTVAEQRYPDLAKKLKGENGMEELSQALGKAIKDNNLVDALAQAIKDKDLSRDLVNALARKFKPLVEKINDPQGQKELMGALVETLGGKEELINTLFAKLKEALPVINDVNTPEGQKKLVNTAVEALGGQEAIINQILSQAGDLHTEEGRTKLLSQLIDSQIDPKTWRGWFLRALTGIGSGKKPTSAPANPTR